MQNLWSRSSLSFLRKENYDTVFKGNKDEINFIDSDEGNGYAEIIKDFTQIIKMNGFYFVNLLWQYIPIQNKN
ncbi:hypothetical protein SAMN02787100_2487 [Chryseobacterium sp. OV279]|nr:hypothetical protein SAMN02787100_2487 [Chryseobacterium sp. OV279]